ncbi:MAG: phage tail tape measure protein [Elusimicrobiales bacterium]|nr:phage tail tape measure protein [Elusimicrobiales bacterium]
MATRVISTKLAIEGENSYRQSISRINGEIKALKSALALTESQFQTNANSMRALEEKGKALASLYEAQKSKVDSLKAALENAKAAEERYRQEKEKLTEKLRANNDALERLKNTEGDTSQQEKELAAENKKLTDQLEACDGKLAAAEKGAAAWKNQLNNAEIQLNDLDAQIKRNNGYLDEAKRSADGCATSIDQFGDRVEGAAKSSDTLTQALTAAGVIAALKKTAEMFESCAGSSIEFESAMAGVAKTTDLSKAELEAMGQNIQALSHRIPASTTEIAAVVEAAGQLGIAKEDLLSFSEVMLMLGTSTNLSSEEAASALAKFANVVNMSPENYSRLGSTIVDLGNNFATTEADITSMAARLASSGTIVGLAEPQIMAISTALSSVGIEAEAGGGSISKLLREFDVMVATGDEKLEGFAKIAGMTAEQFRTAWGQDAVRALGAFIDGLEEVERGGGSAAAVLEALGITEIRMSNAVLALSTSDGILQKALDTAETAWEADTALQTEANTRYATTESKLQMLSNKAETLKTAFGDKLNPVVNDFIDMAGDVLEWATNMVEKSDTLAPLLFSCATGMGLFVTAVGGYNLIGKLANTLLSGLAAAASGNPFFLAAAGVAALAGAVALFIDATKGENPAQTLDSLTEAAQNLPTAISDAEKNFKDTASNIESAVIAVDNYCKRLKELESQGELTKVDQLEYAYILGRIQELMPGINAQIDEQTGLLIDGADALRQQADAWKYKALQEALAARYSAEIAAKDQAQLEVIENQWKLRQAENEGNDLLSKRAEVENKLAEAQEKLASVPFASDEYYAANNAVSDLSYELSRLQGQIWENEDTQNLLNEAISAGEATVSEYEQTIRNAEDALNAYVEESRDSQSASENFASGMAQNQEAISAVTDKLKELAESYKAAYDAAYESISGQIGLFDQFQDANEETNYSAEKMVEIWNQQARSLEAYTENLRKAKEFGLDPRLIESLSDGTAESAKHIATIVGEIENAGGSAGELTKSAENFINTFNAAYGQTEDAKTGFAATVASIQTDLKNSLTGLEQEASDAGLSGFAEAWKKALEDAGVDFQQVGSDAAAGLVKGMKDSEQDVTDAGKEMGQALTDGNKAQLEVNSPSKVFERIGGNCGDGLSIGLRGKIEGIKEAAKSIGAQLSEQMAASARQAADAYEESMKAVTEKTRSILATLSTTAAAGASDFPARMRGIGENAIDGMTAGMRNRSSQLYATIRSIVENSITVAKNAADVHSPSGKTREIFEYVGDGMILGLEDRRKKLADTVQDVVNQALAFEANGRVLELAAGIDARMPELVPVYGKMNAYGETAPVRNTVTVNLSIDRFENNSDRDLDSITEYIEERIQTNFMKKEAAV